MRANRSFQRLDVGNQGINLRRLKFAGKSRHLACFTLADPCCDLLSGPIQIMQVRSFIAVRIGTMTMRAVS